MKIEKHLKLQIKLQIFMGVCIFMTVVAFIVMLNQKPKYTKADISDGWCYVSSNGRIYNVMPPDECDEMFSKNREAIKRFELAENTTAEKWIEEDGELIGGTYIKKYGYDFTSSKTGKRYTGKE